MPESELRDLESIRRFLRARGWVPMASGARFERFKPPDSLNLGDKFWLTVPRGTSSSASAARNVDAISKVLAQIYGWSPGNIQRAIQDENTVFSIRLAGTESVREGTLPLPDAERLLGHVKALLRDVADFAATDLPFVGRAMQAAEAFVESCLFLQTEKGSFIARIEVPATITLREGDLLRSRITGLDATHRLSEVLTFVKQKVLSGDTAIYEDEFLVASSDLLNVDVLTDVAELLGQAGAREIGFQFTSSEAERVIDSARTSGEEMSRLRGYVDFVRERLSHQVPINAVGSVVELRSRDPEQGKNIVTISTPDKKYGLPIVVSLGTQEYFLALEAHRDKRPVRIRGSGVVLKTQIKVVELESFGFLS